MCRGALESVAHVFIASQLSSRIEGQLSSRIEGTRETAMGAMCGRRQRPWEAYSDREEEVTAPSTSAQRRFRPSTTSMSSGELFTYAQDVTHPRKAEAAARELANRKSAYLNDQHS